VPYLQQPIGERIMRGPGVATTPRSETESPFVLLGADAGACRLDYAPMAKGGADIVGLVRRTLERW